jgi:hypothetical protein
MKPLFQTYLKRRLSGVIAIAAFSSLAHADYDCTGREVMATAAQKDMYKRATLALHAALLPPPEGWVMRVHQLYEPSERLCLDFKNEPKAFGASATYTLRPSIKDLRAVNESYTEINNDAKGLSSLPPNLQAKVDALQAVHVQLSKEIEDARRKGNQQLVSAKMEAMYGNNDKMDKIYKDFTASISERSEAVKTKQDAATRLEQGQSFTISLMANEAARASEGNVERIQFGSNEKTNQATDRVVRVVASIEREPGGTTQQLQTVKRFIDEKRLLVLVAGALPLLQESQAAIARQDQAIAALDKQDNERRRAASASPPPPK